jgi:hypothetical protein
MKNRRVLFSFASLFLIAGCGDTNESFTVACDGVIEVSGIGPKTQRPYSTSYKFQNRHLIISDSNKVECSTWTNDSIVCVSGTKIPAESILTLDRISGQVNYASVNHFFQGKCEKRSQGKF